MKPPIVNAATLVAVFAGLLPAADSSLLNLVMPDAKVLAGVNVDQAKVSPFGQYVLSQIQAQGPQLQQMIALTGFDPTRDVSELLVASNAVPGSKGGLVLARGIFDSTHIQTAAQAGGGVLETYKSVTLLEDPKQTNAVAFLTATLAVAGDVASVKAAVDRQNAPVPLGAAVLVQVHDLSIAQDAWVISLVPPQALHPPANSGTSPNPALQNAFQNIQQASGGLKFGTNIVVTGQAQADTAQNAAALVNVVQFVVNLAQMQAPQQNPQAAAVLKSLSITASGNLVNLSLAVPEAQVEQIVNTKPGPTAAPASVRPRARRL